MNEGNRTPNNRIHSPALCHLSYIHHADLSQNLGNEPGSYHPSRGLSSPPWESIPMGPVV